MLESYIQNEVTRALTIFLLFALAGYLFQILWKKVITKAFVKTSMKSLDGHVIGGIASPLGKVIILVGLYLAFKELTAFESHYELAYKIFYILFILLSAIIVSRMLTGIIDKWLEVRKHYTRIPELINKFVVIIVYILAIFMVLLHFDIEITPLLATLGVGGLAAGLALQKTLGDFFAGVHIISDKPIRVGDFVEMDGNISGYIEDIGWRSTRIRTLPDNIVIVPNSKLAESTLTNTSLPLPEMSILVECGVSYKSDLEKVEKVTIEVAKMIQKSVEGAVKDFEPFIRYHTFGDSNINFTVILRVRSSVDKFLVKHEFIKSLKKRFDKEKIEISWPVRKVIMKKI